jgi:hypothetical protein
VSLVKPLPCTEQFGKRGHVDHWQDAVRPSLSEATQGLWHEMSNGLLSPQHLHQRDIGSMVTQLAPEAGAYVIGTGRAADRQTALDFGANEFVDLENDALEPGTRSGMILQIPQH